MNPFENERPSEREGYGLSELLDLLSKRRTAVLVGLGLTFLASFLLLAWVNPTYRARATLLLDDPSAGGGVLGDLAALTKAPPAVSEIEILRSRTLAEAVVGVPEGGTHGLASNPSAADHLGLVTRVEDLGLHPLTALGERFFGERRDLEGEERAVRLFASASAVEEDAVESFRVEFLGEDRVLLSAEGLFGGPEPAEIQLRPGAPATWGGLALELAVRGGDPTGWRFRVECEPAVRAVERVLKHTFVRETERNAGVIELTFEDTDPDRAAETANALCRLYLERNRARGERKASYTAGYIEEQLAAQIEALETAELELVDLREAAPHSMALGKTAEVLIERMAELEVERATSALMRASLEDALSLLAEGDAAGLARLGPELADPLTQSYIEQIALLTADYEVQDRSDTGVYRSLLQTREIELETAAQELELLIAGVRDAMRAVEAGAEDAVGRIGGVSDTLTADPLMEVTLEQLATLRATEASMEARYTPKHPERKRLNERIAELEGRVLGLLQNRLDGLEGQAQETRGLLTEHRARVAGAPAKERVHIAGALERMQERTRSHLESRVAGLQQLEAGYAGELTRLEGELGLLPDEQRQLAHPLRRIEAHGEIVKFLLGRQQEAEIARAATLATAEFIDPAVRPLRRHGPSIPLYLGGGLVLGLLVGIGLALLRESLTPFVFTSSELEDATGLPVFGQIPDFRAGKTKVRGAGKDFLALRDDPEGPVAEAYRSLRANLKFVVGRENDVRTLACTSCGQGEGKSVTNIDLALSFAGAGQRVLLVDADMRRPSVHQYLRLELEGGLSDVLEGRSSWEGEVRRAVEPGLDVLCAGTQPRSPADLLAGEGAERLLAELSEAYDLVVVDLPPALAVSDAEGFAARLDALLFVCRSSRVPREVVSRAAGRLRHAGAPLVGSVLNAVRATRAGDRYGVSSYGYGSAYHETREQRAAG